MNVNERLARQEENRRLLPSERTGLPVDDFDVDALVAVVDESLADVGAERQAADGPQRQRPSRRRTQQRLRDVAPARLQRRLAFGAGLGVRKQRPHADVTVQRRAHHVLVLDLQKKKFE